MHFFARVAFNRLTIFFFQFHPLSREWRHLVYFLPLPSDCVIAVRGSAALCGRPPWRNWRSWRNQRQLRVRRWQQLNWERSQRKPLLTKGKLNVTWPKFRLHGVWYLVFTICSQCIDPRIFGLIRARTHGENGTLLQINVPRVMILSQKLGKFIWQGDLYLTVRDVYLRLRVIYLTRRDIYLTGRDIYFVTNY